MKGRAPDALDDTVDASGDGDANVAADTTFVEDEAGQPGPPRDDAAPAQPGRSDDATRDELATLNDRYLRLAAEFDNYRKRTERERTDTWARSQADLAAGLLDILDDLGRVAHVDPASAAAPAVIEGVQLVERKLLRALSSAGLEEVEAQDERFDPATMEALMTVEAESPAQDETVAAVFQKGYRFKGQLLRPARVQVRKYNG